ncbi:MAG: protein kinase [Ardenticatenaceae bacterium]|nr:protein kinase [Anaerolineales bacterium]MCB8922293.1 protein kinase [Ardenticatenaceae bacterium]MCB8990522.1 protein kinase [Ardenticatenaceae bacterium]MCB9005672.1 protein kinase [Ardenticatenaceae bacterium]
MRATHKEAEDSPDTLTVGNLRIDRQRHLVTISGQEVVLSPTEFDILLYLVEEAPKVISPQILMQHLYEYEADSHEASSVIRNNIYRIRSKLKKISGKNDIIRTVRGVGYAVNLPKKTGSGEAQMVDGRYQLEDLIGQGGAASVYKAYQQSLDRYVAIKILHPILLKNTSFQERFRMEARHMANLYHQNIIQVYDFGNQGNNYYIVMELVEGETLEEKLHRLESKQQRLPLPQAIQIIQEIGSALAYAHQQGIMHRDIKPDNIMVTSDNRIVLTDFGLAKLVAAPHITAEGNMSGTPNYMAPEQIRGASVDTRVDIYGLGVVMYRLITGRLPFAAQSAIQVMFQHIKEMPQLPGSLVPDLPEELEFIILKALAKHPDERYQTMEELLADLNNPQNVSGKLAYLLPIFETQSLPPHHLPAPLTPFIPREKEVSAIKTRLAQPNIRLLTLVGIGGVGKTRLVLEVGKNILPIFDDGVFFIDLTTVQRPALLPGMIGQLVNMAEEGEASIKEQLLAYLSKRRLLLIFDNFEHILDAAPLVSEILTAAPQCKILTTSREPLRLYGETLFPIDPLPLPDLRQQIPYDDLVDYTAVQLFTTRAQAVVPDFAVTPENIYQIAELCIQLDGLPLALELAASQVYTYSLTQLIAQLQNRLSFLVDGPRDRSARQQTMRGAIEWSYALLTEKEQLAFRQLGIFAGSFSAEAAQELIGDIDLDRLVQKSLLRQKTGNEGQPLYWMLQVLREYALEQLETDTGFKDLQKRYAAFYLDFAETAEPHLTGPNQDIWLARLEEAHDNFRSILHFNLEAETSETAVRLGGILWRLWAAYSYLSEGTLWLEEIMRQTIPSQTRLQAKVLLGAGRLALFQQKLTRAAQLFHQSLHLYQVLQDRVAQAMLLNSLGEIALQQSFYDQADKLFHEALTIYEAQTDKAGIGQTLSHLGQLAFYQGQHEQANILLLQSLELAEQVGAPEAIAITLNGLGEIARLQKRYKAAMAFYERSLTLCQQLNYKMNQALVLHNLGQVQLAQENFQEAASLFRKSLSLLTTMEEKIYIGWNMAGLGAALLNMDNIRHAVRLFGATDALFKKFGGQLDVPDQLVYDHFLAKSKQKLTEVSWQQAWYEGQTMPIENELLNIIALTPLLPQTNSSY